MANYDRKNPRAHGAGRKKGTINKASRSLRQKAEELGVDPFEILLLFAGNKWKELGYKSNTRVVARSPQGIAVVDFTIPIPIRKGAAADACEFLEPKLKAIEHSGDGVKAFQTLTEMILSAVSKDDPSPAEPERDTSSPEILPPKSP